NQFGREFCQSDVISFGPAKVDEDVVALNVAEVAQPSSKLFQSALYTRLRVSTEKSNACDFCRPLRACRERPCSRAADERHERAAFHAASPPRGRLGVPSQRLPAGNRRVF